jgi:hypothetical protein
MPATIQQLKLTRVHPDLLTTSKCDQVLNLALTIFRSLALENENAEGHHLFHYIFSLMQYEAHVQQYCRQVTPCLLYFKFSFLLNVTSSKSLPHFVCGVLSYDNEQTSNEGFNTGIQRADLVRKVKSNSSTVKG